MIECEECGGTGEMEVDYHMSHNSGRDVGFIDTQVEECDWCCGAGEVEGDE